MCAILGFITTKPHKDNAKKLHDLYDALDIRGRDACGIAIYRPWEKEAKKKFIISKKAIPVNRWLKEIFPYYIKDIERSPLVVGHIRAQTQGTPKDPHNNHPVTGNKYLLTHNGSVTTTPRIEDYNYKGEVDTEIIVSYLEKKGFDGLKDIHGVASIAFVDFIANPPILYLWSHNQTFYLGMKEIGQEYWWSSTDTGLDKVSDTHNLIFSNMRTAKFPEDRLLTLGFEEKELVFKSLGEYKGQAAIYSYSNTSYNRAYQKQDKINAIPVHMMEGAEEGVEFLYAWNTNLRRYILDIEYCKENKVRPYLDEEDLKDIDYINTWPKESCVFDQHNWRVVNTAVGLQSVALARTMIDLEEEN